MAEDLKTLESLYLDLKQAYEKVEKARKSGAQPYSAYGDFSAADFALQNELKKWEAKGVDVKEINATMREKMGLKF